MTYNTIATMARDEQLALRITAAAATQGVMDPEAWVYPRVWQIVAQPGWADSWESAVAGGIENLGGHEGVITDGMILSAVQPLSAPPVEPDPEPEPEPGPDPEPTPPEEPTVEPEEGAP